MDMFQLLLIILLAAMIGSLFLGLILVLVQLNHIEHQLEDLGRARTELYGRVGALRDRVQNLEALHEAKQASHIPIR